jgi:hypothetical protein
MLKNKGASMPRISATTSEAIQKKCGDPAATAHRYGIGIGKLKTMRLLGIGPEFRVAGHRTILYDWATFETWLASLPKGGGGTR